MAYSEKDKAKLIDIICKEVSNGRALRNVLMIPNMPSSSTFYDWIDLDENKSKQYARACEERAERMFEDILTIADSQENDVITLEDGKEVANHDVINRARLRIDSRKWMLGKMQPKKYGEKLDLSSSDGSMTPQQTIITTLTEEQLKESLSK